MNIIKCPCCKGCGKEPHYRLGSVSVTYYQSNCLLCKGSGKIKLKPGSSVCDLCSGSGKEIFRDSANEIYKIAHSCSKCCGQGVIVESSIRTL